MKYGMLRLFPSTKGVAPSGPETAYRHWSRYACHRPRALPRRRLPHNGGNRRDAWNKAEKPASPKKRNELETALGELIRSDGRLMAARADCGRTLARSHGHYDTLLVGTVVGVLVDKPRKRWQRFRIVISSMTRKWASANLYHKPLQTREPQDR